MVYGWVEETGLADLQGQSDPVGEQSSCHNLGGDMVDIFSTHLQHPEEGFAIFPLSFTPECEESLRSEVLVSLTDMAVLTSTAFVH